MAAPWLWSYKEGMTGGVPEDPDAAIATEVYLVGRTATLGSVTMWGGFDFATAVSPPLAVDIRIYFKPEGAPAEDAPTLLHQYRVLPGDITVTPPEFIGDIQIRARITNGDLLFPGSYWISSVVVTSPGVRWYHSAVEPTTLRQANEIDMQWDTVNKEWIPQPDGADARVLISFANCEEYFKLFPQMSLLIFGVDFPDVEMGINDREFDWSTLYKPDGSPDLVGGKVTDHIKLASNAEVSIGEITIAPTVTRIAQNLLDGPDALVTTQDNRIAMWSSIKEKVLATIRLVDNGKYDPDKYDMYIAYLPKFTSPIADPSPIFFIKDYWIPAPSETSPAVHVHNFARLALIPPAYYLLPESTPSPVAVRRNLVVNSGAEIAFGNDYFPWMHDGAGAWTTGVSGPLPHADGGAAYFMPSVLATEATLYQDVSIRNYAVGTQFWFGVLVRSGNTASATRAMLDFGAGATWDSGEIPGTETAGDNNNRNWKWVTYEWTKMSEVHTNVRISLRSTRPDASQSLPAAKPNSAFFDNVTFRVSKHFEGTADAQRLAGAASTDATGFPWLVYPSARMPLTSTTMLPEFNVRDKTLFNPSWLPDKYVRTFTTDQRFELSAHNVPLLPDEETIGTDPIRAVRLGTSDSRWWLQYTYVASYEELGQGLQVMFEQADGRLVYIDGTPYSQENCWTEADLNGAPAVNPDDDDLDDDDLDGDNDNDNDNDGDERRAPPAVRMFCNMKETVIPVGGSLDLGYVQIFVRGINAPEIPTKATLDVQLFFNNMFQCPVPGVFGPQCTKQCPGGAVKPCNGHGVCNNGVCTCDDGWWGDACASNDACQGGALPGSGCGCDVDKVDKPLTFSSNPSLPAGPAYGVVTFLTVANPAHLRTITFWMVNTGGCYCPIDRCVCPPLKPDSITFNLYDTPDTGILRTDTIASKWIMLQTNPLLGDNVATVTVTFPQDAEISLNTLWPEDNGAMKYYYLDIRPMWNTYSGNYGIVTEHFTGGAQAAFDWAIVPPNGDWTAQTNNHIKAFFELEDCNGIYEPEGIPLPASMTADPPTARKFLDFSTNSVTADQTERAKARVGEPVTLTFSGYVVYAQTVWAKIADRKAGYGCTGVVAGGEERLVDPVTLQATFRINDIGFYAVCLRIREDWEEITRELEVRPALPNLNFYGYQSCAGVVGDAVVGPNGGKVCGCMYQQYGAGDDRKVVVSMEHPFWAITGGSVPVKVLQGCCAVRPDFQQRNDFLRNGLPTVDGQGNRDSWGICEDSDVNRFVDDSNQDQFPELP
eukprot:TRINITY_DN64725_c0_g2_i1.p1 TRINITY_DN64725_c0_g2~~TRINITY_DN64725_c0_g2_i1.p1  ORF type:complete len:1295 (-),score=220.21 TRINITY_DN64725_c0_g2_i1:276-4103(-)